MPVPKRRHCRSRTGKRRAHDFLVKPNWGKCSQCGEPKRPHCVCQTCGYYDRKEIKPPKEMQ